MNRMKKLLLVFLLFANCLAYAFQATVTEVISGDTFKATITDMYTDEKVNVRIRLWGIDCPKYNKRYEKNNEKTHKNQPFGKNATDFTRRLIADKKVNVVDKGRDKYGRVLGIVTVGSDNVNEKLLESGLAWVYVEFYNGSYYYNLEKVARNAKLNIWKDPKSIAPWKWRKMSKEDKELIYGRR